jgi:hypothetical protein
MNPTPIKEGIRAHSVRATQRAAETCRSNSQAGHLDFVAWGTSLARVGRIDRSTGEPPSTRRCRRS